MIVQDTFLVIGGKDKEFTNDNGNKISFTECKLADQEGNIFALSTVEDIKAKDIQKFSGKEAIAEINVYTDQYGRPKFKLVSLITE